ncbi:hypothetical protein [Streptomyces carpinensis]|uniref:DUF4352 domain-containing protein n=1 Tax=Streptomyces carpinensis TaxID=66369 RepID=A0ABV1W6W0_9ACTN|nr:hypothetical protein [Streptomyces carpinensis]
MTSNDNEPVTEGHSEGASTAAAADELSPRPENDSKGFWTRPQGVVAVVGGLISALAAITGLVFLLVPDWQPEPKPSMGLELVESDVVREKDIRAEISEDGSPAGAFNEKASTLSVTLRNTSDDPILITSAEAHFSSVKEVGCPYGAGVADLKALYDIRVPPLRRGAFTVKREFKYTVPPHSQERVGFSVGPERSWEGFLPLVYTFTLVLHPDHGASLIVPEATQLAPQSAADTVLGTARALAEREPYASVPTPACVRKQAAIVQKTVSAAKRPSPELREFSAELTRIAQRL